MFPAAVSFLLIFMTWRHALWIMSAVGIAVAVSPPWVQSVYRQVSNAILCLCFATATVIHSWYAATIGLSSE